MAGHVVRFGDRPDHGSQHSRITRRVWRRSDDDRKALYPTSSRACEGPTKKSRNGNCGWRSGERPRVRPATLLASLLPLMPLPLSAVPSTLSGSRAMPALGSFRTDRRVSGQPRRRWIAKRSHASHALALSEKAQRLISTHAASMDWLDWLRQSSSDLSRERAQLQSTGDRVFSVAM